MKRLFQTISITFFALALFGCARETEPQTPLDTLKAYNQATKEKNTKEMKSLLSKGSIKMAEDEARAQNAPVDEIVQRETFYSPGQTTIEYRNQKIQGDQATIEVKNSYGTWDIVPFVKEDGEWKIAKDRYAEELMKQVEEENRRQEEQINQSRQP